MIVSVACIFACPPSLVNGAPTSGKMGFDPSKGGFDPSKGGMDPSKGGMNGPAYDPFAGGKGPAQQGPPGQVAAHCILCVLCVHTL